MAAVGEGVCVCFYRDMAPDRDPDLRSPRRRQPRALGVLAVSQSSGGSFFTRRSRGGFGAPPDFGGSHKCSGRGRGDSGRGRGGPRDGSGGAGSVRL